MSLKIWYIFSSDHHMYISHFTAESCLGAPQRVSKEELGLSFVGSCISPPNALPSLKTGGIPKCLVPFASKMKLQDGTPHKEHSAWFPHLQTKAQPSV